MTFNRAFEVHGIYRFPSIPCLNLLLEERLTSLELEAKLAPNDDPDRPMQLFSMGCTLFIRYERNGSLEELNVGVAAIEDSLNGLPQSSQMGCTSTLGCLLIKRFEHTGSLEDLNHGLEALEKSSNAMLEGHSDKIRCGNYGNAMIRRFQRFQCLEDANKGVAALQDALALTDKNSPSRATYLYNLGNALRNRYERTGARGKIWKIQLSITKNLSSYFANVRPGWRHTKATSHRHC